VWLDLGAEERRLFEREFADVAPLRKGGDRVLPDGGGVVRGAARASKQREFHADHALAIDRHDGIVTGTSHGVSRETLRMLARGEIRAQDTCDLHGLRAEPARRRLQRFIEQSARADLRVVLVICGRGLHSGGAGPVLRDLAVEVLCGRATCAHVLAFSTASAARGGEGALAILLRRPVMAE
jgi:DNA-nicking Smr family endonuclease